MRKNFLGDYKVDYRITEITSFVEKLSGWQKRSITKLEELQAILKNFMADKKSITKLQALQALRIKLSGRL